MSTDSLTGKGAKRIMSGAMIRALLEGRKTQTRRIIKPQPVIRSPIDVPRIVLDNPCNPPEHFGRWQAGHGDATSYRYFDCPYGKSGDLLWVRESVWIYRATESALSGAKVAPWSWAFVIPASDRFEQPFPIPPWSHKNLRYHRHRKCGIR
jgi:hypothetical protein